MQKLLCLLSIGLLFSCNAEPEATHVKVSGRQILVNETPYLIKGICYHPVPKGSTSRDFARLDEDLALMKEAGINTIRLYAPVDDKAVLDAMHAAGMKVIIGFGYSQGEVFDIKSGTFIDYINTYKNHPAILMWELGNEYNYHPEWFGGDIRNWYKPMNEAAGKIHEVDPSHPVTTAHGELPDKLALASCPNIDVWGMNVYRWDNPAPIFLEWKRVCDKPMYLSEAGGDSYMTADGGGYRQGENQKAQAEANKKILKEIFKHQDLCLGVTLFSFSDGWWKAGNPGQQDAGGFAPNSSGVPYDGTANEEYWGIVDIDRSPKQTFKEVQKIYTKLP
jgi:hypothetical protein